jgi:hypothetical protein
VASRAIRRRLDVFSRDAIEVPLYKVGWLDVTHRRDLLFRPKVQFGLSVALDAPTHGKRLDLLHHIHQIDPAVTRFAPDPVVGVDRVAESGIIREHVDVYPLDRRIG